MRHAASHTRYALETNYKAAFITSEEKLNREILSRYMRMFYIREHLVVERLYNDSDDSSANNTMGIILKELLIFEVEVVIV